jgi:hypothetical protein
VGSLAPPRIDVDGRGREERPCDAGNIPPELIVGSRDPSPGESDGGSSETIMRLEQEVERCIGELKRGELTEESLRRILAVSGRPRRQDLLYLQAGSTSPGAPVHGMLLVVDGEIREPPDDVGEWPYRTVLDAIRDGWRIIQFPDLGLMVDETRTYGLGCEFILERWSE